MSSNLYNQYNNNRPTTTGGSFDDYDSIVDEFSMPGYNTDNNTNNNNNGGGLSDYGIGRGGDDQSDVSSMQMSEMGGVSVGMENNHRNGGSARYNNNGNNNSPARSGLSIATPTDIHEQEDNNGNGGVASPLQFLPSHLVATNNQHNNNGPPNQPHDVLNTSQSSTSKNSTSFNIDVDESGYYHVGDYRMEGLGIDTTDVSAILGMQHSIDNDNKQFDEESLLADAGSNITGVESGLMTNVAAGRKKSSRGQQQQLQQQRQTVGPLGDNMSYTGSNNTPTNVQHIAYDSSSSNSLNDNDDEENEENYGILPNWIAFSSQRSKCIFVTSTAFVVSALVLAVVALGVSYGTGNFGVSPNGGNNGSDALVQPIPSDGSGSIPSDGNIDLNTLINNSTKEEEDDVDDNIGFGFNAGVVEVTDSPSSSPIVIAPVSSSSPTLAPPVTSSPVVSGPTSVFVSPTTPAIPVSSSPTLKPITLTPSTLTVLTPTTTPSTTNKPSWSYGTESNEAGDATFYLMADGGSNFQFWSDKLRSLNLDQDQKFIVHLGSATRKVDNIPDCTETAYLRTQLSLSQSPITVYTLPGNNDYPECEDPQEGWSNYEEYMLNINTMYWNTTQEYVVKRQEDVRDENFSFLYKRTLFIGLNMVTNSNEEETTARVDDNIDWFKENIDVYSTNADIIFIMGYGRLLATEMEPFYDVLVNTTSSEEWSDKLFVYARRASDTGIEYDIDGKTNLAELKVGNEWPILDVRVRTKGKDAPVVEYRKVVEEDDRRIFN